MKKINKLLLIILLMIVFSANVFADQASIIKTNINVTVKSFVDGTGNSSITKFNFTIITEGGKIEYLSLGNSTNIDDIRETIFIRNLPACIKTSDELLTEACVAFNNSLVECATSKGKLIENYDNYQRECLDEKQKYNSGSAEANKSLIAILQGQNNNLQTETNKLKTDLQNQPNPWLYALFGVGGGVLGMFIREWKKYPKIPSGYEATAQNVYSESVPESLRKRADSVEEERYSKRGEK